MAYSNFAII